MENGKKIERENAEFPLPEAVIQHIQSFLRTFEAIRTTVLSKSWYNAWVTRPMLNIDDREFGEDLFEEFVTKTIQRYQDLSVKIESLRLNCSYYSTDEARHFLIANAMKIGATDVQLEGARLSLPQEVLGSENLLSLSVRYCRVNGNYTIGCSSLKSLTLKNVEITSGDDVFKNIISCCISLEELSLTSCRGLAVKGMSMYGLRKLTRLYLSEMVIDSMFLSSFASRCPCLKDLTIHYCNGCTNIKIASTSLETISFKLFKESWKARATFDVPNICKFTYAGFGIPPLFIKGALREWELDISILCVCIHKASWFLNLKKLLRNFRLSRISLSIKLERLEHGWSEYGLSEHGWSEHVVDVEVVAEPLVVENVTIEVPATFCTALLVRLFGYFRPKFVSHFWQLSCRRRRSFSSDEVKDETIDILCKRLLQQVITPNCGIPDQSTFGPFGLKKVNMEVCEMIDTKWQPLLLETPLDASKASKNERKVRFELIWEDDDGQGLKSTKTSIEKDKTTSNASQRRVLARPMGPKAAKAKANTSTGTGTGTRTEELESEAYLSTKNKFLASLAELKKIAERARARADKEISRVDKKILSADTSRMVAEVKARQGCL